MKLQKLFPTIVVFWLVTGAGGVFAQDRCDRFFITDQEFESLSLVGQSCYLYNVTISGDLTVINSGNFSIQESRVGGTIRLLASDDAQIQHTEANKVIARGNTKTVLGGVQANDAISVVNNGVAYVGLNFARVIRCKDNIRLVAGQNHATERNTCSTPGL
jgi:hypothetical protein